MNYTRFWYNQSHMEGPKKPKLRIEHFSDDSKKQDKQPSSEEIGFTKPLDQTIPLLEGDMDFADDPEKQKKLEKLREMYREIADKEIKTEEDLEKLSEIEFSLRQLLLP